MTAAAFVLRRLGDDWRLLAAVFAGMAVAAALLAGAPVYLSTLERQGINTAIDRASQSALDVYVIAPYVALSRESLDNAERAFEGAARGGVLADVYVGRERHLKTPTFLVGTERAPLPAPGSAGSGTVAASRGYFQNMTNLAAHVDFVEGRMAAGAADWSGGRPKVEAVMGARSKSAFGLEVGDSVEMSPSPGDPVRVVAQIVGILEASNPADGYWRGNPNLFIAPPPLEETPDAGVSVNPDEPPLALFVSREALIDGVGAAYPGMLASSSWSAAADREALKRLSADETRAGIAEMKARMSAEMSGATVLTGVERLLDGFERRSFFASAPLLLLLAIAAITALYYVGMMVSYLVSSREADMALLRSRGAGGWRLARIYAAEGAAIALVAAALAPFLAMGGVALAGKLPYFAEITRGEFLPVSLEWTPFAVSAAVGACCLALYAVPGALGARTSPAVRKARESRPPSMPLFQRYYADAGLIAVGGVVFWEMFSRGRIISGGLFGAEGVNEALLLAPPLMLTVAALLFMRFFPLAVRFLSGESPALSHLLGAAALGALAALVALGILRDGFALDRAIPLAHLAVIAALYIATWRARRRWTAFGAFALQTAAVALFLYRAPPQSGEIAYIPALALAVMPPFQALFWALGGLSRRYPAWASIAIWRMARDPLRYSWLTLLIVMAAGLGTLAATVGGTLDRSYEERVLYEVAADMRIAADFGRSGETMDAAKRRYLDLPGVAAASLAMRTDGTLGTNRYGGEFGILAVESDDFPYVSWYRDDFSERSLPQLMNLLGSGANLPPVTLPEGARSLGVWTKAGGEYSNLFLWMALRDRRGVAETITFGEIAGEEWRFMEAEVPRNLAAPIDLVSVQIYEPAFGPTGTAGTIFLDNIQAEDAAGEVHILDDFEGAGKWIPLSTSALSSDAIGFTRRGAKRGNRSGAFTFGQDTDRGIRGFYRSPNGGPIPVVASAGFMRRAGMARGDSAVVSVRGRLVPIRVVDSAEYFPTMDPSGGGFIVADLESLLRHLDIVSPSGAGGPNEVFIAESPGAGDAAQLAARGTLARPDAILRGADLLDAIRLDPMISAGWRAVALASAGVIILSAAFGCAAYSLSRSRRTMNEAGFLRALGFRRGETVRLLAAEHAAIIALGLALGAATGFAMSGAMASALAVTEDGRAVIPPYALTTDWAYAAFVYGALIAIFAGGMAWLARKATRAGLREMARTEGE